MRHEHAGAEPAPEDLEQPLDALVVAQRPVPGVREPGHAEVVVGDPVTLLERLEMEGEVRHRAHVAEDHALRRNPLVGEHLEDDGHGRRAVRLMDAERRARLETRPARRAERLLLVRRDLPEEAQAAALLAVDADLADHPGANAVDAVAGARRG